MTEVRTADPDVVEVLVSAGVGLTEWHLPAELDERPLGSPICHDDLLDFHELLSQDNWLDQLVAIDQVLQEIEPSEATPKTA